MRPPHALGQFTGRAGRVLGLAGAFGALLLAGAAQAAASAHTGAIKPLHASSASATAANSAPSAAAATASNNSASAVAGSDASASAQALAGRSAADNAGTNAAPTAAPAAAAAGASAPGAAPALGLPAPNALGPGPMSAPSAGNLWQTIFALLAVLAALAGFAWFMKRYGPKASGATAHLRTVGSLNLGGRERIVVVEVGDQWIVVGASPGRINALATMPKQFVPADEASPVAPAATPNFAHWLKQTIDKRNA